MTLHKDAVTVAVGTVDLDSNVAVTGGAVMVTVSSVDRTCVAVVVVVVSVLCVPVTVGLTDTVTVVEGAEAVTVSAVTPMQEQALAYWPAAEQAEA